MNAANANHKQRRKRKHARSAPAASSTLSAPQLKKKIRDTTRLLALDTSKLSATARAEHEKALEAYKHQLGAIKDGEKMDAVRKKYHMVRFFERQKATRKVNQLRKKLLPSPSSDSSSDVKSELHEAEVDLAYILHYPPLEKYVSLYRRDGEDTKSDKKRKSIRERIEADMAAGRISLNTKSSDKADKRRKGGSRAHVGSGSEDDGAEEEDQHEALTWVGKDKEDEDDFFEF